MTSTGDFNSKLRYQALALQIRTNSVGHLPDRASARALLTANVERAATAIAASIAFVRQYDGSDVRLVVLPEYSLTGAPAGGTLRGWRDKAALEPDGPEYRALGKIAAANGIFLAANAYEADPHFPELYFQTSFILDPAGALILRYRRLISLYSPSPYDVWDRYVALYGEDALFPVADTAIGRLAAIASEEILYPEIARCHAMRGAEVFVHSTSEMGSPHATAKDIGKRARAAENLAYVVSANAGEVDNTALPSCSTTGMSKIVDYEGRILAAAAPGGDSMVANATLDVGALRARRRQSGLSNTLVRQPFQAYGESYRRGAFHAPNQLQGLSDEKLSVDTLRQTQRQNIERLSRLGSI
jgi:predicted amidohydrolase